MKLNYTKKSVRNLFICIAIIVVGIVFDQLTKMIFQHLDESGRLPVTLIHGILSINFALNTGAAWGSFAGNSVMFFVLTIIALPMFVFIMVWRINNGMIGSVGFALIISGAIGNAIDRAFFGDAFYNGAVRDFLETKFLGNINFICNLADIWLTVGVVLVLVGMLFTDTDAFFKKQEKLEDDTAKNDFFEEDSFSQPNDVDVVDDVIERVDVDD